ncbi:MAG: holliday junction DNA helicase RuvA [Rhodospirillaceae bacterium]|nr:MAG: holliday junction DNA helicase RuvA [Rhodospirillaceae bacterium]
MIARLKGIIDARGEDWVVLDVQGVGYLAHCSGRTLAQLPGPGEAAVLHVETVVREDAITLYGFRDRDERNWFRLLTTVQGVGAKVALSLLSTFPPERLAQILVAQDKTALTRAVGVGPRLAARLLTELKDKGHTLIAGGGQTGETTGDRAGEGTPGTGILPHGTAAADAVSALVNLGYGRGEALSLVARVEALLPPGAPPPDVGALVRLTLQESARRGGG